MSCRTCLRVTGFVAATLPVLHPWVLTTNKTRLSEVADLRLKRVNCCRVGAGQPGRNVGAPHHLSKSNHVCSDGRNPLETVAQREAEVAARTVRASDFLYLLLRAVGEGHFVELLEEHLLADDVLKAQLDV